ncbi:hypothetical protein BO83DRAFT_400720 [Aspergillus eucalypticola CBS 122712]|uniref:Uncharacterized protein n=1 Tax=Aspergillus eucalypticola (strain CBS 122712 / IBT 29274) TaxID=1448314 RepID=A0A317V5V3_ASPEC|nr:uncharacterized protein BO83DRAFT_400720 [Aspergillus eucalypticola CBS 122712]PWY68262.1 hypothetical protein BO83DRAFT_400720 [Aspergillus eucalypticola CBS 122712]
MSHPINKFQPFPNFYVYRPGYMVVPLIPLDELPSWIQVGDFDWGDSSLYEAMLPASFNCFPRIGEYDVICHHCYKNVDSYHRSVSERSDSNASSRASDLPKGLAAQLPANSILLDPSFKLEQPPFGASLNVSPFVGLCFSSRKRLRECFQPKQPRPPGSSGGGQPLGTTGDGQPSGTTGGGQPSGTTGGGQPPESTGGGQPLGTTGGGQPPESSGGGQPPESTGGGQPSGTTGGGQPPESTGGGQPLGTTGGGQPPESTGGGQPSETTGDGQRPEPTSDEQRPEPTSDEQRPGHPPPANTPENFPVDHPAESPNPSAIPPLNSPPESPDHSNPSLPGEEGTRLVSMSHSDQGHRASQASQAFQENGTHQTGEGIRAFMRYLNRQGDHPAPETAITESSSIHAVPITGTDRPAEAEQEGEAPPRNHVNGATPVDTPGHAASVSASVEHTQPQANGGGEAATSGDSGNISFRRRRARHRDGLNRRGQLFEDDVSAPEMEIGRIDSVGSLLPLGQIQPRQDRQRQYHEDQIRSDLERGVKTPDDILGETCTGQGGIPEGVDGDAEDKGAEDHPEAGDDDEDEGEDEEDAVEED